MELTRYHFGSDLRRPYLFPVNGPSGPSLTRMGHPHDSESHSHHNSVWISHNDVNGVSFWSDRDPGRIVHRRMGRLEDSAAAASVLAVNDWVTGNGKVLLTERRLMTVMRLPRHEWLLILDLELAPAQDAITLGKTPFGLVGVRMAKSIGVHDGGGTIRNSAGGVNEDGCFWKRAEWVDYSGPITRHALEGVTLMDHPANPNHPTVFHVRNDGWMGAALTQDAPRVLSPGAPLRLRYGLYVHTGVPKPAALQARWNQFRTLPLLELR